MTFHSTTVSQNTLDVWQNFNSLKIGKSLVQGTNQPPFCEPRSLIVFISLPDTRGKLKKHEIFENLILTFLCFYLYLFVGFGLFYFTFRKGISMLSGNCKSFIENLVPFQNASGCCGGKRKGIRAHAHEKNLYDF